MQVFRNRAKYIPGLAACSAVLLVLAGCRAGSPLSPVDSASGDGRGSIVAITSDDGRALGSVRFPTSCNAHSQALLERGLALLHHMTYDDAEVVFRSAADADPQCAIAYWGQAMTYVHPLWPDTISPASFVKGQDLLAKAAAALHSSDRERSYIHALQAYYGNAGDESEPVRLQRFAGAWATTHEDYPDDSEAKLFYALALLATGMSDQSLATQRAVASLAEQVLAEIPDHPGANHYLIHADDSPALARHALPVARRYGDVAPENAHALHMTSHIFTRLGLWQESIDFNRRSAQAATARTADGAVSMHRLHALDYLAYAYLQTGDDDAALAVLRQAESLQPPYQDHAATAYAFAAIPARYVLERQDWEEASMLEIRTPDGVPWDQYPHLVAISQFARAIGAARTGDRRRAEVAIRNLAELHQQAAAMNSAYNWGEQVAIQQASAEAWLQYESGDVQNALVLMRKAADMESATEKNPVTPSEVLPARELYADMLLDSGKFVEAESQYAAVLERSPNRFNSLFGAGRAAELAGDIATAASWYRKLLEVSTDSGGTRKQLQHARESLMAGMH